MVIFDHPSEFPLLRLKVIFLASDRFQYEKWDNTLQSIPWDSCCYDPPSRSEVVDSLVASRSCCASEHDITGIMGRKKSPAA
jgi:hypothetical protein